MSTSYSWEGKGRCGSFRLRIERVGVQVKLWDPVRTRRAIPERFWGDEFTDRRYMKCTHLFLYLYRRVRSCDGVCACVRVAAAQCSSVLSLRRQSALLRPVHHDRHLRQQRGAGRRRSRPRALVPQLRPQLLRLRLHVRLHHRDGPEGWLVGWSVGV